MKNDYSIIKEKIEEADVIVIGAGLGLSISTGVRYGYKDFSNHFKELVDEYGFVDMQSSMIYEFDTEEEYWSFFSKCISYLSLEIEPCNTYLKLFHYVKNKDYFVITTNLDRQFIKSGFDSSKVFEYNGNLLKMQCSGACHNKTYDLTEKIKEMVKKNHYVTIPKEVVPKCPICGEGMVVNMRKDKYFVEDEDWNQHKKDFEDFIIENKDKKILFLELEADLITSSIIRYPFEELTALLKNAYLIRISKRFAKIPMSIEKKAIVFFDDSSSVIEKINDN